MTGTQYTQPPVQPGGRDNTQLYGIIGIITAFVCCAPLGILFGWLSMREARENGQDGLLGKIAFWAGIVMTTLSVLGVIAAICLGGFGALIDSSRY